MCSCLVKYLLFIFLQIFLLFARQTHGRRRSLVRMAASILPLKPVPRVHFKIVDCDNDTDSEARSVVYQGLASIPILDHQEKIELWK